MQAEELISHFNRIYGLNKRPQTYEVDSDTYANCCQAIFDDYLMPLKLNQQLVISINIGPNGGLIFKGVELILQGYKKK